MKRVRVLGSRVPVVSMDDALAHVEEMIADGPARCRQVIVTGFHGVWEGHKDPGFRSVLNGADFWIPDGVSVPLILRLRGHPMRRLTGPDFMASLLERGAERGYRSYFFGDTEDTLDALRARVEERYPGNRIAGAFSPPFRTITSDEDQAQVDRINAARPDILWVGLGLPKQERWIHEHLDRLRVPVAIGVGAAFGFLSGRVKRAPAWMGELGFEWAYRLVVEPRKCMRRSLVEGPRFILAVMRESVGGRLQSA
jgi:N-acetylglucosaminyldiphosphoundecaprenol N-acetyl-beta-D-mannosaminyltransferase